MEESYEPSDHLAQLRLLIEQREPGVFFDTANIGCEWAVVPVDKLPLLMHPAYTEAAPAERECEWLVRAIAEMGNPECLAYRLVGETLEFTGAFMATVEDLRNACGSLSEQPVVISTRSLDFVLLLPPSSFFLVAGPFQFVRTGVGGSIPTARDSFDIEPDFDGWVDEYRLFAYNRSFSFNGLPGRWLETAVEAAVRTMLDSLLPKSFTGLLDPSRPWCVVPVYGDFPHFTLQSARWIAAGFAAAEVTSCYATSIGQDSAITRVREVPVDPDSFIAISWYLNGHDCLVASPDGEIVILSLFEDWKLFAGPQQIVEIMINCSLSTARKSFERYIRPFPNDGGYAGFMKVIEMYR